MRNSKPYNTYKFSGVDWLGSIPSHWEVISLKYLLKKIYTGGTPDTSNDSLWSENESGTPWVSIADITKSKKILKDTKKRITPKGLESKRLEIIPKGTLLISIFASLGKTVRLDIDATVNQAIIGLVCNNRIFTDYLDYFLVFNELNLKYYSSSNTQDNLNLRKIKDLCLNLPSLPEQQAITEFLNYKLDKIDRFILKKKKLIKLLNEQKAAIIFQAVTKGLDPNAIIKPSGIDWLGDIPEHWESTKAKWIFTEIDERSSTGKEELLSVSHITGVTKRSEKNVTMFLAESYIGNKLCSPDDLVINIMWAWMGALGISSNHGIVSNAYGVYRLRDKNVFYPKYLDYLLRTKGYIVEYTKKSTGIHSSRLRLYSDKFFEILIVQPPKTEQVEIVQFIEKETATINLTISTIEKEIALVQEYRTTLIAEAVTGKIDVRGYEIPTIDEDEETLDEAELEIETEEEIIEEDTK